MHNANSKNPNIIFTEFSHPPDLGRFSNQLGKIAKRENAIFIVEVHSSKKMSIMENTDRILHWCKQNNYRSYYLSEHREIKNSDSVKNRGRYHLLLIHKNTNYPEGLKNIRKTSILHCLL